MKSFNLSTGIDLIFCTLTQTSALFTDKRANVHACVFFLLIVVLALGSVSVLVFGISVAISDALNLRFGLRFPVALVVCVVFFLIGLILVTPAGLAILQILDDYVIWIPLFILALILIISFIIYSK